MSRHQRHGAASTDMAITLSDAQKKAADIVASIAQKLGIDPRLAVADAYQESKLDVNAKGDYVNGTPTSFGLFQLHKGGELGNLTPDQAFDPTTNATTALGVFDNLDTQYSGGTLAAKAQRPAAPGQYATDVNALVASGAFDQWASGGSSAANGSSDGASSSGTTTSGSGSLKLLSTPIGDVSLPTSGLVRVSVIVVGFLLVVIGLHALTSNAQTPIGVIGQGVGNTADNAKRHVQKTGTAAATVASA